MNFRKGLNKFIVALAALFMIGFSGFISVSEFNEVGKSNGWYSIFHLGFSFLMFLGTIISVGLFYFILADDGRES